MATNETEKEKKRPSTAGSEYVDGMIVLSKFMGGVVASAIIDMNMKITEYDVSEEDGGGGGSVGGGGGGRKEKSIPKGDPDKAFERNERGNEKDDNANEEKIEEPEITPILRKTAVFNSPYQKKRVKGIFYNNLNNRFRDAFNIIKNSYHEDIDKFSKVLEKGGPNEAEEGLYKGLERVKNQIKNIRGKSNGEILIAIKQIVDAVPPMSSVNIPNLGNSLEIIKEIKSFINGRTPIAAKNIFNKLQGFQVLTNLCNEAIGQLNESSDRKKLNFDIRWVISAESQDSEIFRSRETEVDDVHDEDIVKKSPGISWLSYIFNTMLDETFSFSGGPSSAQAEMDERLKYNSEYNRLSKLYKEFKAGYDKAVNDDDQTGITEFSLKIKEVRKKLKDLNDNYNPGKHGYNERILKESLREVKDKQNITRLAVKLLKKRKQLLDEKDKLEEEKSKLLQEKVDLENSDASDGDKKKGSEEILVKIKEINSKIKKVNLELRVLERSLNSIKDKAGDFNLQLKFDEYKEEKEEEDEKEFLRQRNLKKQVERLDREEDDSFDLSDLLVLG